MEIDELIAIKTSDFLDAMAEQTYKSNNIEGIILEVVREYTGITFNQMLSKSRRRELVTARAMCYKLERMFTDNTLTYIGEKFGGRDHTTILHGLNTWEALMFTDVRFKELFEKVEQVIEAEINKRLNPWGHLSNSKAKRLNRLKFKNKISKSFRSDRSKKYLLNRRRIINNRLT